jgi:hypothetical protein
MTTPRKIEFDSHVALNHDGITEEKFITPEKGLSKAAAEPSPDVVKSSVEFDEREYEILYNRYLKERVRENETLPGGMQLRRQKKSRLLDDPNISGYKELGKEVDRLLKRGNRHGVFELLSQLRDFELNPRRVPAALKFISPACDEVAECVDLTNDWEDECIDVERYIVDVLLRKEDDESRHPKIAVKDEPCLDSVKHEGSLPNSSVQKRYFDELDGDVLLRQEDESCNPKIAVKDGDVLLRKENESCNPKIAVKDEPCLDAVKHESSLPNSSGQKRCFEELDGDMSESDDDCSRFSQGCCAIDHDLQSEPDHSNGAKNDGVQLNQTEGAGNIHGVELSQQEIDKAKKEKIRRERIKLRKYGDRLLLARQCSIKQEDGTTELKGMLALGGGNQTSHMWYKDSVSSFCPNLH